MAPQNPSSFDDIVLDHLERYCVEGDSALADIAVAETVARYQGAASQLRPVIVSLRAESTVSAHQSFAHAITQMDQPNASLHQHPKLDSSRSRWFRHETWITIPAVYAILLAITVGLYQWTDRKALSNSVVTNIDTNGVTYRASNGQRTTVNLKDGSTVVLNSGSQLNVPNDFGREHRTLALVGEALFTVTHETQTPFIVMAGVTATRVLGTTFVVRHYRTDTATSVAVQDGRVAVQSVVVPAQWQASVTSSGAVTLTPAPEGRFTFASGALTINDMSLPDAITELSRWYDVDIRLAHPSLTQHRVTAIFHAGSIADLAAVLELALDVRIEQVGRTLVLYPKGS